MFNIPCSICNVHYNPSNLFARARISPNFQNCARYVKALKDSKHDSLHLGRNMLGYLSLDIICSSKLTVFLELRSRKTVRFSEQIMSADKYPSIFSRQMETIVYICSVQYSKGNSVLKAPTLTKLEAFAP